MSGFSFNEPAEAGREAASNPGAGDLPHHTPAIIAHFGKTRPWVLFLAVIGIIAAAVLLLAAVLLVATAGFGVAADSSAFPKDGMGLFFFVFGALFYGLAAAVTAFCAILLFKYSGAIGRVVARQRTEDIEQALDAQRVFFKVFGITTIAAIALSILSMVAAVAAGIAMAANGMP